MNKILYTLLSAGILLLANVFVANGTFQVAVESPTPLPSPTLMPLRETEPAPEMMSPSCDTPVSRL